MWSWRGLGTGQEIRPGLTLHLQFPKLSMEAPWGSRQSFPACSTNPPANCQGRKRKWLGQGR